MRRRVYNLPTKNALNNVLLSCVYETCVSKVGRPNKRQWPRVAECSKSVCFAEILLRFYVDLVWWLLLLRVRHWGWLLRVLRV